MFDATRAPQWRSLAALVGLGVRLVAPPAAADRWRRFRCLRPRTAALCLGATLLATEAGGATFTVNSTTDAADAVLDGICDAGGSVCTLRAAIQEANATAGVDFIHFNIGGGGLQSLSPGSPYPTITETVIIDGTTQPGYTGAPIIEIDGSLAGVGDGLALLGAGSSSSTIRGLVIGQFGSGYGISMTNSSNNVVAGNYIGTDPTGTLARANSSGVLVQDASDNRIGGTVTADRNVISGNTNRGVTIVGASATSNLVQGNFIGLQVNGSAGLSNATGVRIEGGASNNTVGGDADGAGNVISWNIGTGVLIDGANANVVQRNRIGTDASGTADRGNGRDGVLIFAGGSDNLIGGTSANGNLISGNGWNGVDIVGSSGNRVSGNLIGTDVTGTADLGNSDNGVYISQAATANIIGEAPGGNVISGNDDAGVRISDGGTNDNIVQLNYIGLDITGSAGLGNSDYGVLLEAGTPASGNVIGGVGLGNVISGNGQHGILIFSQMTGTLVIGNIVGRNAANTGTVRNMNHTVQINDSSGNTIGGTLAGEGNVLSGSDSGDGVSVVGAGTGNAILGNSIFANAQRGIDHGQDAVTPNDVGDGDVGPNNLQNFPVLSAAVTDGVGSLHVAGSLDSAPNTTFRVEFFSVTFPDPTGHGEGPVYLGFTNVTTGPTGYAPIGLNLPVLVSAGEYLTATATDPGNNTSEFAQNVTVVADLVVTTTADTVDGATTSIQNLIANPGADGRISLREAIEATNATAGTDTIRFGIPLTDGGHVYYRDDASPASLTTVANTPLADADIADFDADYPTGFARSWYRIRPTSALPAITDPIVVDGETQPGFIAGAPVIELDGSLSGAGSGLSLTTGPSTVRGLVINRFTSEGLALRGATSGYTVTGNYIGTDVSGTVGPGNGSHGIYIGEIGGDPSTIGGNTAAGRNVISANGSNGIYLSGIGAPGISSQIRIQGNYIGTDVTGTVGLGAQSVGVNAESTGGHLIGGAGAGEGNVLSGQTSRAIELNGDVSGAGMGSDGNVIEGNWIGTNAAGTAAIGNGQHAIFMFASGPGSTVSNNVIRGNVLAASGGGSDGIGMSGNADGNVIENNFIGTDSTGTLDLGNTGNGILVQTSGGSIPTGIIVRGNAIRFNALDGVRILGTGSTATVSENEIWSNDGLGIDLGGDGVTANDAGDVDNGPNSLLNFPVLTLVTETSGTLSVDFDLDLPSGSYRIEFFKNPSEVDPTLFGEGQSFASSTIVAHPGGPASYSNSFSGAVGDRLAATATLCSDGASCLAPSDTSEFSGIVGVTTAVELESFEAEAGDASVELRWKTASELDNIGFHLYRATTPTGGFEPVSSRLIPGLGSSPSGATYEYRDTGLENGVAHHYVLEDVDSTGRTTRHGPVSATPRAGLVDENEPSKLSDNGDLEARVTYGEPEANRFEILPWRSGVLLVLETRGFVAVAQKDGSVRLEVPGLEHFTGESLPVKRAWLEALPDRKVKILSVRTGEVERFDGLRSSAAIVSELEAAPSGTVRARLRRQGQRPVRRGGAKILEVAYQGETKKALVELSPFAWDGSAIELAKRLEVYVAFRGREARARPDRRGNRSASMRLATVDRGLYSVPLEELVGKRQARRIDTLRLSRQAESVPYHLDEGILYFWSEGADANPYGNEAIYELELDVAGETMVVVGDSGKDSTFYWETLEQEENRFYQAGLVNAPDIWLWDLLFAPDRKSFRFEVRELSDASQAARLELWLQGASDLAGIEDHHLQVYINGTFVAETRWNGKDAHELDAALAPGLLHEGQNVLELVSTGDTGAAYSMVMLDRFRVRYPRSVTSLERARFLIDLTEDSPRWVVSRTGFDPDRAYVAVQEALRPDIRRVPSATLGEPIQADYLVVGPQAFLEVAVPLVEHRAEQGLRVATASTDSIASEFGHGELSPEAIRDFIAFAYHEWGEPQPRYLLLLGDATYDFKDYLGTAIENQLPPFMVRTSYLWTASDPAYAAVNGDDLLPDLAVGRLPAKTTQELAAIVAKILAYEQGDIGAEKFVLIADDSDVAGDFERDAEEIAETLLSGREIERIYLGELGASAAREAILESFDAGASTMSYLGHGGIHLWADENLFDISQVDRLSPQRRQPLLLTMNCLNGYFHFPYFDSLSEALLKRSDRGIIAAFSPTGLSLNTPAHRYHKLFLEELLSGRHPRLGDALLAAQERYVDSGAMPELLGIYHLLGDPATLAR